MAKKKNKKNEKTNNVSIDTTNVNEIVSTDEELNESVSIEKEFRVTNNDVVDESAETFESENKNRHFSFSKRTIIGVVFGIAVFSLLLILFVIPMFRYNSGIKSLMNNDFDNACKTFLKLNYKDSKELLEMSENKLVLEVANHVLNNDLNMKSDDLKLASVNNINIIFDGNMQKINYDAIYENKNYQLNGSYYVEKSLNTNGYWVITNYNTLTSEINPLVELDTKIVDAYVSEKFKDCIYKDVKKPNSTTRNYVYSYESEDEPYILYTYEVIVTYEFDKVNGKWKASDIYSQFIDKKEAVLEEKHTSFFTFKLPESWSLSYLSESPNYISVEYMSGLKNGSYSGTAYVSIYLHPSGGYYQVKEENAQANHGLGAGSYKNNDNYISGEYYPLIDGTYNVMNINAYNLTDKQFKEFFSSLKVKRTTYSIKVITNAINIRSGPSTYYDVVGKVKNGNKYTSMYKTVSNDGYTWYMIGENQWIADKNNEWLQITER